MSWEKDKANFFSFSFFPCGIGIFLPPLLCFLVLSLGLLSTIRLILGGIIDREAYEISKRKRKNHGFFF
jgi:hypothetical protein